MRLRCCLIFSCFTLMLGAVFAHVPVAWAAGSANIAAVVGEDVVSTSEFQDRMKMIMVTSGIRPTPEAVQQLGPQALDALIEEKIKMQEAEKLALDVSAEEIRQRLEQIAQLNNVDADQFEKMVRSSGVNFETLRDQIKAQVAWTKVIQAKLHAQVRVTDNDIENQKERFQRGLGKDEVLAAEIFLPFDQDKKEAEIKKLAQSLIDKIESGQARFSRVAMQFSRAPGANQGGDMGWIQDGQLAPELNQALLTTPKGKISKPVRMVNGYHIFLIRDKRTLSAESIPSEDELRNALGTARLDRLQQRYLMDLRAATFIDVRV